MNALSADIFLHPFRRNQRTDAKQRLRKQEAVFHFPAPSIEIQRILKYNLPVIIIPNT